ncbi:MAG: DUF1761 domain-containing protein [Anaerolineales bacterium]|nr:DUF1761 domain-containing protein [Anaerolineales bacterium]
MLETLNLSSINMPAVLAAAAVMFGAGWIWYLPNVFGDAWSGLVKADRKPDRRWLGIGLVGHLLMALVLAVVVNLARTGSVVDGLFIGILLWLGFIVAPEINRLVWKKNPLQSVHGPGRQLPDRLGAGRPDPRRPAMNDRGSASSRPPPSGRISTGSRG